MKELIKISENKTVSARELHLWFGVKTEFASWIKRMLDYGFIENVDYSLVKIGERNAHNKIDYALSIDCAKEISMLQKSDKGKQARAFFIECEKVAMQAIKPMSQLEIVQYSLTHLIEQSKRIEAVEEKVKQIEANQITSPIGFFSVAGYGSINGYKVDITLASNLGRKATSLCNQLGYIMGVTPDPRFGKVKTYPTEVLEKVFDEWSKKI